MGNLPKITILFSNGNLLQSITALDGISGLVGTGYTPALIGVPKTVLNLDDAVAQGFTEDDEPVAYRHLKEFYQEVAGNQELHIMLVPDTMTLAQMVDDTEAEGAKKLLRNAEGAIRLLAIFRKPDDAYSGAGSDFIDADVEAALTISKAFAEARLAELSPIRILIEGRVANFEVAATANYLVTVAGSAGAVASLSVNDGVSDIVLGSYTVQTSDTPTLVATGLRAAIAALTSTHHYVPSGSGANVLVTVPAGRGSNANSYALTQHNTGAVTGTITDFAGGQFEVTNTLQPKTFSNGYAGVVLGGTLADGSASVGEALGRAVKYGAEIKIGKVANGPLSVPGLRYIGEQQIKDVLNLDSLAGDGFIVFMKHPQKAGYYFGIDKMASTDDYRLLAYGRIVDKAAVIAAATYTEDLEGEVDIDTQGRIDSLALSALETEILQQIAINMGSQISGVSVYINPAQDVITNGVLAIQISIKPKGYKTFINVTIGLTTLSV